MNIEPNVADWLHIVQVTQVVNREFHSISFSVSFHEVDRIPVVSVESICDIPLSSPETAASLFAPSMHAVVPNEDALEVEATVLNKDIGFVRPGQPVTLKLESVPYTCYGYLEDTVETVSHDAAQDEHLGLVFPARVRLNKSALMVDGVTVSLTPGMSLSAEIKTGKRRLIDYVLSPLQRHGGEAFREK